MKTTHIPKTRFKNTNNRMLHPYPRPVIDLTSIISVREYRVQYLTRLKDTLFGSANIKSESLKKDIC